MSYVATLKSSQTESACIATLKCIKVTTMSLLCLSQFQLGTSPPPGNPQGLAQKTCPGGRDLTFEICPGAGNSTRAGILWKMKTKLQKIAWIKFLQVKRKKQAEFLTFFEVYAFSQ